MHLFGHSFDHDYYFELPSEGERDTQSITRCLTSHHSDVQVVPRANRTFSPARNPIPCASSSKGEPPVFVPWPPWRFSVRAASSSGHTCSAILEGCARTCAASTSRKRNREFPCFVICPSRRRFPLEFSNGTSPR